MWRRQNAVARRNPEIMSCGTCRSNHIRTEARMPWKEPNIPKLAVAYKWLVL
jgi:hypothetical protein